MMERESLLSTLPLKYHYKDLVKCHVLDLFKHQKSLIPKMDIYFFNDGREKQLLHLEGTIPVPYKGQTFNIPITIILVDSYPYQEPLVYAKPTSSMQIKVSKNVDASGRIYLPYLNQWKHPTSDLIVLIQICISTFSELPPVFGKPKPSDGNILGVLKHLSVKELNPSSQDVTKRHVDDLLEHFNRHLRCKYVKTKSKDGEENIVTSFDGTIPVPYKGQTYNIPVEFTLTQKYPHEAPVAKVKPTPEMKIKVSKNVDASGKLGLPYLQKWTYPKSDLKGLVFACMANFRDQPPVFTIIKQPEDYAFIRKTMKPSRNIDSEDAFDIKCRLANGHFLQMGGKNGTIKDVDVVQNHKLETAFENKRMKFKRENIPHEYIFAYHGTKSSVIDNIMKENFDSTKAQRQLHGPGNYFSEYPNTALGYSDDKKHLIFCKVLPGRQYKGAEKTWSGFDSKLVKPNLEDYSEMVIIQDKDQILPICVLNF